MNNNLIFSFTLDYELMGNGDGNIYDLMINPTNRFLKVLDKYNVKSTIFFEVVEYWKIKEAFQKGKLKEYKTDPTSDIEKQLKDAVKAGHDVQLHIHPQWLTAEYINGRWRLDDKLYLLVELKNRNVGGYTITDLLKAGKKNLEDLFKPIKSNYRCHIFRAGGLNIYPDEDILRALRENNFDTDSSTFPYGYADSKFTRYDYSNITNKNLYWVTKTDKLIDPNFIDGDKRPFLELPIFALLEKRYRKYDLFRIYNKLFNNSATATTVSQAKDKLGGKNIFQKLKYFIEEESITWDFCLFNKNKHKYYLDFIKNEQINGNKNIRPVVLIGHSKEINDKNILSIEWLINQIKNQGYNIESLNFISRKILSSN